MPFALFKNDPNLDELVTRLFASDRKLSKTAAKQAAAALVRANPQLQDMSRVPAGSLIRIPDTAPALVASEAAQAPAPALALAAANAQQVIQSLAVQLSAIDNRARSAAESLVELANARDIPRDTTGLMALSEALPFAREPSKTLVKDLEKSLNSRDQALADLLNHVASLSGSTAATNRTPAL